MTYNLKILTSGKQQNFSSNITMLLKVFYLEKILKEKNPCEF